MINLPAIYVPKEYPHVTENEAEAIWFAAKNPRFRLFIKVLWFTGLRINEALSLKVKDLEHNKFEFTLVVVRLKKRNLKPERLPISRELGTDLYDYIQATALKPNDRIFPGHENTYRYQVKVCARRAGLPNWREVHPHSFRHGFVYHKVKANIHPFVLSKLVGHSNLSGTLRYYQPTEADLRQAMEV